MATCVRYWSRATRLEIRLILGEAVSVEPVWAEIAAARGNRISEFLQWQPKGTPAAGKATWQLATLSGSEPDQRAAVVWLVCDAIMRSRCGRAPIYQLWRHALLRGKKLDRTDSERLLPFVRDVFGTRESPGNVDHLEGYVAEWLWYLLMLEQEDERDIALLEPPKFRVTDAGPDGFVVYAVDGLPMVFRLWELKKQTGSGKVDATIRGAYTQLRNEGERYLAQLTAMHVDKTGDLGDLCARLVDLWIDADPIAGAGVGVTSATFPPPRRCFTTMGRHLPQFREPGQLEGLLCAVDEFRSMATDVREMLWSAL